MSASQNPKKWTRAERVEQARAAWQLSLDGHSQPVIAQTLGIGRSTLRRRLHSYEKSLVLESSEHWRKKQIERTEDLINALQPHIKPGVVEVPFVGQYLKAMALLDSYTGAALPTKSELTITVQDSQDAELAELIAMTTAQDQLAEVDDRHLSVQTDVQDETSV